MVLVEVGHYIYVSVLLVIIVDSLAVRDSAKMYIVKIMCIFFTVEKIICLTIRVFSFLKRHNSNFVYNFCKNS